MTRSHKRLITSKKKTLFVSYLVMKALKVKLRKEKEKILFFLSSYRIFGIIRVNSGKSYFFSILPI